ncbi:MAG TPA: ATP-binding protein [Anaerolineaceae bacterium]|nr:ATP-binding protein [Anaerolineaceae bacterium]
MDDPFALTPEMLVPRLGDALVEKGILTADELQKALFTQEEMRANGKLLRLGQVLDEMGLVDKITLDSVIAEQILSLRAALEDANAQLERRVIERTAQLQDALQKLSELNQVKSNFVANISHELRTPLTHLKGYLELLLNGDLGTLSEDQLHAMKTMSRASDRLNRLIEDLIAFSMAERGDVAVKPSKINLAAIGLTTINRTAAKAAEKTIILDFICSSNTIIVEADEEKVTWVLLQLIDNALKFTPAHGRVWLEMAVAGEMAQVTVNDTGIGIPPDRVDEVFEPFHQLDESSTRKFGGTGLGLSLARKIVEAHGSEIRVSSEVGKGSRFEFFLKLAQNSHD